MSWYSAIAFSSSALQCTMDCQKVRKSANTTKFDLARRGPKFYLGGMVFWVKNQQMCPTKKNWLNPTNLVREKSQKRSEVLSVVNSDFGFLGLFS